MNKLREKPEDQEKEITDKPPKQNKVARSFVALFSGNFLSKENTVRQLPFLIFLTIIGLGYIANGYYAEKTVRDINRVANELKELKSQYVITKSDLMFISKQSEVAKSAASLGLKESVSPPKKIVAETKTMTEQKK